MSRGSKVSKKSFKDELVNTKHHGIYMGVTRDSQDAQRRGRIAVFVPAFFGSPSADVVDNWITCDWTSPFWGQTYRGIRGKDEKNYTNSQSTYGMWMVPPDPGTYVLIAFIEGNYKFPVIISCLLNNQYNYSVPGFPGGVSFGDPAVNAPVTEKNLNAQPGEHGPFVPRPMHADIAEQITEQGLINDPIRGAGTSGARRESPSKVFGIMTPGDWDPREPADGEGKVRLAGHQLVMDDKRGQRLIRLRSGGGNQLLLNDDVGTIYCVNSKGDVWWEMDQSGNFTMYAKRGIHLRTKGDFNLRADGTINMEAGGDFNIKAAGDMRGDQYVGGLIQEVAGGFGLPTVGTGGRVNITGKQSLQFYGDRNVRLTSGGGDLDINAGGVLNLQGNGVSPINGAAVNISAPSLGSVLIHASTNLQLQGMFLELAAPSISAGGGIINLNTKPPVPLPPGIALPAFKLTGKPMKDQNPDPVPFEREAAKQGASAFPTQGKREGIALDVYTICTKLATAEPYEGHPKSDPLERASDPDFLSSIVDNLPPGSSGDPANPAPGDVVVTDPETGESVVKKGIGYVDEAGNAVKSAQDQVQDAYDQASGQIQGEIDAVKNDLKEQFPEYEEYADVYNNLGSLLDGDLSAIQRIDVLIGMLGATIPPVRFPTSTQLEEEVAGLNSKLTELEAKLAEYGIDADQLMADLLTGNIAGLKAQASGLMKDALAENTDLANLNTEIKQKFNEAGLDIAGLDPTDPMFPSIAVTDKDGNTFVDFSKGMSDPAAALLAGSKLNTEMAKIEAEIPNITNQLGDTQKSGLLSFADSLGGNDKFIQSNVGQELKKANALFEQANAGGGTRTPEQQSALNVANGIMANVPRLMSGWVLVAKTPGGKMELDQGLVDQRAVEVELFTATDDMNLKRFLNEVVPGGETYGSILTKIRAYKKEYFAQKEATGKDSEFGKAVQATA